MYLMRWSMITLCYHQLNWSQRFIQVDSLPFREPPKVIIYVEHLIV